MFIGSFILGLKSLNLVSLNTGIGLFGGLFHTTATTNTFHVFIIFISFIVLQLTSFYSRKLYINGNNNLDNKFKINNILTNKMNEQYRIIEYPLIILFIITGAIFLISSSDIVSIFLSIELQSYGLYLLCTLYRNSELSTSAGLTYFLLGGLSSCFILLGTALLYTNSGTTSLESFYIITNLSEVGYNISDLMSLYNNDYINYSLLIMSIGFLFKISAAPFHF
jgi:NADH-ubiquinone oxidoreductase chain 2